MIFNSPLIVVLVEEISDHLLHAYWLNYFSHAEGVLKAIENTWKLVIFIVLHLHLHLAGSSAYHTHTIDTSGYLSSRKHAYIMLTPLNPVFI